MARFTTATFGLLRIFFGRALPIWIAVVRLPKPSEEATAFASKNPVDFSHGSMSIVYFIIKNFADSR